MSALGTKMRQGEDGAILYYCPGCGTCHKVMTGQGSGPRWVFNGDAERPTFTPSIRVRFGDAPDALHCHCFITDGMIRFLPDSTHKLAGQIVPLPDWPLDW